MAEGVGGGGGRGKASGFNETEGFEDYDPDPYDGGYDIAETYGKPLPPSPAICYPVDGGVPKKPTPVPPAAQVPVGPPLAPEEKMEEENKEAAARPNEHEGDLPRRRCSCRRYLERCKFWNGKRGFRKWAGDSLFDYLPFYGKRREEGLRFANLGYAYERHACQEPDTVVMDPSVEEFCPEMEGCDFYESRGCSEGGDYPLLENLSGYERQRCDAEPDMTEGLRYYEGFMGESYPSMEQVCSYDELYRNRDDSVGDYPDWSGGVSYSDVHQNGIFSLTEYVGAYERQAHGNSISIDVEPPETREVTYHVAQNKGEDPHEFSSAYQSQRYEMFFPYEIDKAEGTYPGDYTQIDGPVLDYVSAFEKKSCENSVSIEIKPDLTGRLGHNEAYQDGIYSLFQYVDPYEKNRYGQPPAVEAETIDHSWSSSANYHKDYLGEMNYHDEAVYPVEHNSYDYEMHTNAPLEPYEPAWQRDLRHYDTYQQERPSQHKYDGGSEEYGAWSSWLFD